MTKEDFKKFMDLMIRAYNACHESEFYVVIIDKSRVDRGEARVLASPNRCPTHFSIATASLALAHAKELVKLGHTASNIEELLNDIDKTESFEDMSPPQPGEKGS